MQTGCQCFRNKEKKPYTFIYIIIILITIGINNNKCVVLQGKPNAPQRVKKRPFAAVVAEKAPDIKVTAAEMMTGLVDRSDMLTTATLAQPQTLAVMSEVTQGTDGAGQPVLNYMVLPQAYVSAAGGMAAVTAEMASQAVTSSQVINLNHMPAIYTPATYVTTPTDGRLPNHDLGTQAEYSSDMYAAVPSLLQLMHANPQTGQLQYLYMTLTYI